MCIHISLKKSRRLCIFQCNHWFALCIFQPFFNATTGLHSSPSNPQTLLSLVSCYKLNIWVPPYSYIEVLDSSVTVFGDGPLWKKLRLNEVIRVGLWFNRLSSYKKRYFCDSPYSHFTKKRPCEHIVEGSYLQAKGRNLRMKLPLTAPSQPPEVWERNLFKLNSLFCSVVNSLFWYSVTLIQAAIYSVISSY